ncbi:MAG: hypothetical protein LBL97_02535 [Prevotellaceae bacterium]|jgi:hypothetical protein|nr:hypothetical protein [Prevotellaceae bacterium]
MKRLSSLVISRNHLFFVFLVAGYIFDVLLYDFMGFTAADELMALFLIPFAGLVVYERRNTRELLPLLVVGAVFAFYTGYSLLIRSNVWQAVLKDLLIQIKPFLGFFCTYLIAPSFTAQQKRFVVMMCLATSLLMLYVGLSGSIFYYFGHESYFAKTMVATTFLCLYCCSDRWEDLAILLLILSIGLFSTRAKFYGFWGITCFLLLLYKTGFFNPSGRDTLLNGTRCATQQDEIRYSTGRDALLNGTRCATQQDEIRYSTGRDTLLSETSSATRRVKGTDRFWLGLTGILFAVCGLCLILWLGKDKLMLYYIDGMVNSREMWSRPAILLTALSVFTDYIPFGSGLASFASFVSGEYYSPIYAKYGIDHLWGISRENYAYIADAYYPVLAQFGFVGLGLYLYFWIWVVRKSLRLKAAGYAKEAVLVWLSVIFFAIEGVADATFTHNRGFFILLVTAMTLAKCRNESCKKAEEKIS